MWYVFVPLPFLRDPLVISVPYSACLPMIGCLSEGLPSKVLHISHPDAYLTSAIRAPPALKIAGKEESLASMLQLLGLGYYSEHDKAFVDLAVESLKR